MATTPSIFYEFGPFRLDPDRELMLRDGQRLAVTPKALEVLLVLVRRSHEVVRKDELMQAVWPDRVVEEANLSQSIFLLRKLLGDTRRERRYIVTLPGQGYRFAEEVRTVAPDEPQPETAQDDPADIAPVASPPGEPHAGRTARKRMFAGIGALSVAAVLLASGYFIRRWAPMATAAASPKMQAVGAFDPPKDTLVVLPFRNLGGDPRQQYFSDGITEELTSVLGQNGALTVIAWDTASRYRDSGASPRDIGKALNVANLLHGSIQRDGDEVRVIAELVNTRTGAQLWSAHYDGSFKDIFAVQDQVATAIASALQLRFAQADVPAIGTLNPGAHDLVLQGRALEDKRDVASLDAARKVFQRAIALDPDYAEAHAMLSRTLLMLTQRSDLSLQATLPRVRAEAERAVALDPRSADAWVALGNAESSAEPPQNAQALAAYKTALGLDPSNADAHVDYGDLLPVTAGLAQYQQAVKIDPGNANAWNNIAVSWQDKHAWMQAATANKVVIRLDPEAVDSAFALAYAYQQLREYDPMIKAFDLVRPANAMDQEQVDAGRLVYRSLRAPALRSQAMAAVQRLARYRSNLGVAGNLLYMYVALGQTEPALELLTSVCPADPDDCGDLMVSPLFASLRADPRFQKLARKYTTETLQ